MAILKLAIGQENAISGNVVAVALAEGKYGAQYKFSFDSGDDLYLPKESVERQAARLNLLPNELSGTYTFWKKPTPTDPTKGFLNIDPGIRKMGGVNVSQVRSAANDDDYVGRELRSHGIPVAATTFEEIKDKYVNCLGNAVAIANDLSESCALVLTPAEVVAMAATLFIERNKRGV